VETVPEEMHETRSDCFGRDGAVRHRMGDNRYLVS